MELENSYGKVGRRIVGIERDGNYIGRSTKSTSLDSWGYQRLNHQPKSIHGLDLGLSTHMLQICSLVLMWITNNQRGAIPKSADCPWDMFFWPAAFPGLSEKGKA